MLKLKEIHVKNFKSLKDCKFKFRKFNVLVGANASGKTNFVDLFLLLRKIYVDKDRNPFRYWWGYQNAVWNRKEELEISIVFVFEYLFNRRIYNITFETTFTGTGGKFEILNEKLEIGGILSLELEGKVLKILYDREFIRNYFDVFNKLKKEKQFILPPILRSKVKYGISNIAEQSIWVKSKNLFQLIRELRLVKLPKFYQDLTVLFCKSAIGNDYAIIFTPTVKIEGYRYKSLILAISEEILKLFSSTLILKLNIDEIKKPSPEKREDWLLRDGSNLNAVLYNLYLREDGIPERIVTILSYLYPNTNIKFSLTDDQRVYVRIQEDGLELPPVCIADGLYKTLAILSALELKPSIILIDEIENSLHPKALEMILDELRSEDSIVVITTHSPIVVDMTPPEDLVIVEKIAGETKFRRIKNPEEVRKKLKEAGLTFSEGWLYGKI